MTSLSGPLVLVSGATGGLGAPISRHLAQHGAQLTLLGRDITRLQALGLGAELVTGDLCEPETAVQAVLPHRTASARDGRSPFVMHLSAVVAEQPTAGMAAYSASKPALTAYDAAAGRELRRAGIRLVDDERELPSTSFS